MAVKNIEDLNVFRSLICACLNPSSRGGCEGSSSALFVLRYTLWSVLFVRTHLANLPP